jgi:cell division protease FtsH
LNQLLVELDGFTPTDNVLVVAATNRADILDDALCRAGRIDKKIQVGLPDAETRMHIIDIHSKGKPINASMEDMVDITGGLSGADIETLLNEAVLQSIRHDTLPVTQAQLESIQEQLLIGRSVQTHMMTDKMTKRVSVHEIGHALVSLYMEHHGRLRKVTIKSSSSSTPGYTMFETVGDDLITKEYLEERMCVLLGGRAAEEVVFGKDSVSTGAYEDLEQCRNLAESMLAYGFGSKVVYPRFGNSARENMDTDVDFIINSIYKRSVRLIEKNIEVLTALANMLIEKKTLRYTDFIEFFGPGDRDMTTYEIEDSDDDSS